MEDILHSAAEAYQRICNHQYKYTLENGEEFCVVFKPQNFVHLAGLRKLGDVHAFSNQFSANNIYKDILRGKICRCDLECSVHFDTDARERIENLSKIDSLLHTKQVVWNFDRKITRVKTRLKSNVIFFQYEGFNFYLMLGVANDGKTYYPETFFLRFDQAYIQGQKIIAIETLEIT